MIRKFQLNLNTFLFLRIPQFSNFGHRIVNQVIDPIYEISFNINTYKKNLIKINSSKAWVHPYFENRHRLLVYLIVWYQFCMEYYIVYVTNNIENFEEKLKVKLKSITYLLRDYHQFSNTNECSIQKVVIRESDKGYLTNQIKSIGWGGRKDLLKKYESLFVASAEHLPALSALNKRGPSFNKILISYFFPLHLQNNF